MPRKRPPLQSIHDATHQERSVIALLVLARLLPRFDDGWVSQDDFATFGLGIGSRDFHAALRKAIQRGSEVAIALFPQLRIVRRNNASRSREQDRKLKGPVPAALVAWLDADGKEHIHADIWQSYYNSRLAPAGTEDSIAILAAIAVANAHAYKGEGDKALHVLAEAAARYDTPAASLQIDLARVQTLLQCGRDAEARIAAEALYDGLEDPVTQDARTFKGHVILSLVECHLREESYSFSQIRPDLSRLASARLLLPEDDHPALSRLAGYQAFVTKFLVGQTKDPEERNRLESEVIAYCRESLGRWQQGHSATGFPAHMAWNLAEWLLPIDAAVWNFEDVVESLNWFKSTVDVNRAEGAEEDYFALVRMLDRIGWCIDRSLKREDGGAFLEYIETWLPYLYPLRTESNPGSLTPAGLSYLAKVIEICEFNKNWTPDARGPEG